MNNLPPTKRFTFLALLVFILQGSEIFLNFKRKYLQFYFTDLYQTNAINKITHFAFKSWIGSGASMRKTKQNFELFEPTAAKDVTPGHKNQ